MNLAYIEFYNEVLIELDSLLTLTETNSIVRENMEKIKQFCLNEYRKMHIDEEIANKLFNNRKAGIRQSFTAGLKIVIPKELRKLFNGYSKGYLKYYYEPAKFYQIKNERLDEMLKKVIKYQEIVPIINIDSLVDAIDIEKGYTKYFLYNDCEFMQIICGSKRNKTVFDIYGKENLKLPKNIQNHVQFVSQDLINAIKETNFLEPYIMTENVTMLKK